MTGVLPGRQCTRPDCEREATEPESPGSLCATCLGELEAEETAVPSDKPIESGGKNQPDSFSNKTESTEGDGAGNSSNGGDKARYTIKSHTARAVPEALHNLGAVAFPIPPQEKAADRPRTEDTLYAPDDPVIEAYLEAGHNYGIACRGDLAYLDADDPEALTPVIDALAETAWQVTGSRESEGYFLRVPGLDEDIPLEDPATGENIGHIKAAAQSYTVGPGSIHPSGNRYGPLQGDTITTVDEDELREIIEPFCPESKEAGRAATAGDTSTAASHGSQACEGFDDTRLLVSDVLSAGSYPKGARVTHPFHGSDTGANFMVDASGETWRCWRHDCTGNALHLVGIKQDIISCGEWDHGGLNTDTWREIFEATRTAGYDLPEWELSSDDSGTHHEIEQCAPPAYDPEPFDIDARRAEMAGPLFDTVLADDQLHTYRYNQGEGKTTTSGIAAADRDEPHVIYFDKHATGRKFITDDETPDGYLHTKGGEQPYHDCCMDAAVAADEDETPECLTHGHPSQWERMCPIYERDCDDPVRRRYEALVEEVGPNRAHIILGLGDPDRHHWHGEDCHWRRRLAAAEDHDRIVAVHPYATLKTIRDGRLNIIDETVTGLGTDRRLSVEQLTRLANALDSVAHAQPPTDHIRANLHALAAFARDIIDTITDPDALGEIVALDAPTIEWETGREWEGTNFQRSRKYPRKAETLAQAKLTYGDTILRRMNRDADDDGPEWTGEPLGVDLLLAAAAQAGLEADPVRQAIALPPFLDACPWCYSDLTHEHGARTCASDACEWREDTHPFTQHDAERARAIAWLATDERDHPDALAYKALPLPSALPDPGDTLVLDATAERDKIAGLFDVPRDEVAVHGDDDLAMPNLHTTQVLDGQYHQGTMTAAMTDPDTGAHLPYDEWRSCADRTQRTVDNYGDLFRKPLFVCPKDLCQAFDFPDNGVVTHYFGNRGLDATDCDAVMCIGAPHPNVDDLRRDAALLAMGQANNFRVGGAEHSTRRDETGHLAAGEPVYRKLRYEDDGGRGRAVPTKHYTGLVGALFRESRESELEQSLHRIRPLLADEVKHACLLTNVPTSLPIDQVADFAELADPLQALLPVPDGALDLLEAVRDVADGNPPDGFRNGDLIERRGDGTLANKVAGYHRLACLAGVTPCGSDDPPSERTVYTWVEALKDVGLLNPEDYEQRAGISYTADFATLQSALSVLSSNAGCKVAAVRRFQALAKQADGSLAWLTWAREALGLAGDRCEWPPPDKVTDHAPG